MCCSKCGAKGAEVIAIFNPEAARWSLTSGREAQDKAAVRLRKLTERYFVYTVSER